MLRAEDCPFWDPVEKKMDFPYKVLDDKVVVWTPPPPAKMNDLIIPEGWRDDYVKPFGVILAIGPGYWDRRKFNPTHLKPGDVVIFNSQVPWTLDIKVEGERQSYRMMGEKDVWFVVDEENGTEVGEFEYSRGSIRTSIGDMI